MAIILGNSADLSSSGVGKVSMNSSKLAKHMAIFGASGSGKTGAVLGIVEDLIKDNIPVVLVDVKGDMANIALSPLRDQINLRVITPGGSHGERVNLFAGISKPERISNAVSSFLKMLGEKETDPMRSKMHAYVSTVLAHIHSSGLPCTAEVLIDKIVDPPFVSFGALPLNTAIKPSSRHALAGKLNTLLMSPSFEDWRMGEGLDIESFFANTENGKTNVTIYSISHLVDDDDRIFALALLADEILGWTRRQIGSDVLRAALVIDECSGFLPPMSKPATKMPIMMLLKQARALGLGVVLATQNAADVDYKAVGNCDTWLVGKLAMKRDRDRVIPGLLANYVGDQKGLETLVAGLRERQFLVSRPGNLYFVKTKDVECELKGPLSMMELESLTV